MRIHFVFLLAFTLVFMSNCIAMDAFAQIITKGLLSYWTFDKADISGKTVKDVWGKNHGTMMGDIQIVEGKIGEALEFDGQELVNCGNDASLAVTDGLTMEAWVNALIFPGWSNTIISRWDDDQDQRGYMFNFGEGMEAAAASDEVAVIMTELGTWDPFHCQWGTEMALEKNRWYHIVITHDPALDKGNVKAYLDGEFKNEKDWKHKIFPGKANLVIGGYDGPGNGLNGGGNSRWHFGKIDEPRVYNRPLSASEVKQNFNAKGLAVDATGKLALTWGRIKVTI